MKPTPQFLAALGLLALLAAILLMCIGCATRQQTCNPKDTRCNVLLLISTIDVK